MTFQLRILTDDSPMPPLPPPSPPNAASYYPEDTTVQEVFQWYVQNNPNPSKNKKPEKERQRLYGLLVGALGERMCSACRPHDLLAFINQFAGDNAWTRKRWNSTFQRPFNVAVQLGFIVRNPFKGLTFPDGEDGRDWTLDEYRTLLKHAKPYLRRFIMMIRVSGLRPGEIRGLEWRNIQDRGERDRY